MKSPKLFLRIWRNWQTRSSWQTPLVAIRPSANCHRRFVAAPLPTKSLLCKSFAGAPCLSILSPALAGYLLVIFSNLILSICGYGGIGRRARRGKRRFRQFARRQIATSLCCRSSSHKIFASKSFAGAPCLSILSPALAG